MRCTKTAWQTWIHLGLTKNYEDPPDPPAFKEPETKKRKESLTEALAGVAVAFASAMSGGNQKQEVCRSGANNWNPVPVWQSHLEKQ